MLSVILPAAGKSSRMQGIDKLTAMVGGKPVLSFCLQIFEDSPLCDEIILVADNKELQEIAAKYAPTKLKAVAAGGATRTESVLNGLKAASGDFICIHDAARPNLTQELFEKTAEAAFAEGAAIAAIPVADTLKKCADGKIAGTVDRANLFAAQTPQIFRRNWLEKAYEFADDTATDDAELLQRAGYEVFVVQSDPQNFKLTRREDIAMLQEMKKEFRTGSGFDAHRLTENRRLILGGVEIPFDKGLLGHSDADVLLHAICDALLGAAALGDIGKHFPDSDAAFKDISSLLLLEKVAALLKGKGYAISNIDATIIAEKPKLAPYIPQMCENIAAACEIATERVSVKATTTEGMGFCGMGEGIAAQASCLIVR